MTQSVVLDTPVMDNEEEDENLIEEDEYQVQHYNLQGQKYSKD